MKRASHLLSLLSRQTGLVLAPRFSSNVFKHIEFIRLKDKKILVILVSNLGEVQNKIIEADESLTQDELNKFSRYLTEIMGGLSLHEAKRRIMEEMQREKVLFDKLMYRALKLSQKALEDEEEGNLYIEGKEFIFQSPEFADIEKMRQLLLAFEEKSQNHQAFGQGPDGARDPDFHRFRKRIQRDAGLQRDRRPLLERQLYPGNAGGDRADPDGLFRDHSDCGLHRPACGKNHRENGLTAPISKPAAARRAAAGRNAAREGEEQ